MNRYAARTVWAGVSAAMLWSGSVTRAAAQDAPPAPPPDTNKTYMPVARFTVGDVLHYKMQMTENISLKSDKGEAPMPGGGEMKMTASIRMKTAGVKPDGTGVIAVRVEDGQMHAMGQDVPMPQLPDQLMDVSPHGVTKVRNADSMPGAQLMSKIFDPNNLPGMGVALPDHPVKAGDTWTTESPTPTGGKMKFAGTLLGTETVGGVETLKIKMVSTMPMDLSMGPDMKPSTDASKAMMRISGTVTANGIYNVVEQNARLVKAAADITGAMEMRLLGAAAAQSPIGDKISMNLDGKLSLDLTSAAKVGQK